MDKELKDKLNAFLKNIKISEYPEIAKYLNDEYDDYVKSFE